MMIDYINADAPIEPHPSPQRCEEIVRSYAIHERPSSEDPLRHRIQAKIPFVVTDERYTFDDEKIEEMDLRCPEYNVFGGNHYHEYPDGSPDIQEFEWNFTFETWPDQSMTEDEQVEFYLDEGLQQISRNVYGVCSKGFISRSISGVRDEYREPIEPTVSCYVEDDPDPSEFEDEFDIVTRSYDVGTRRYGIDGVIGDAVWYDSWADEL